MELIFTDKETGETFSRYPMLGCPVTSIACGWAPNDILKVIKAMKKT